MPPPLDYLSAAADTACRFSSSQLIALQPDRAESRLVSAQRDGSPTAATKATPSADMDQDAGCSAAMNLFRTAMRAGGDPDTCSRWCSVYFSRSDYAGTFPSMRWGGAGICFAEYAITVIFNSARPAVRRCKL